VVTDIAESIGKIPGVAARRDELLSLHTSFRVGGPCDLMVWASNGGALEEVVAIARSHSLPITVLGNGSNVLVKDGGITGLVIRLVDEFENIEIDGGNIRAGAGARLAEVVNKAASSGIGGLEFLAGIPGTIGGAAMSNAGSKDTWLSNRLVKLGVLTSQIKSIELVSHDLNYGYRTSNLDPGWVVTGAVLAGYNCPVENIRRKVEENLENRSRTQPRGEPTAGCVFRNPPGDFAGRLIEKARLKGYRVGGAQISAIHANFIVNTGGATAGEILNLIQKIKHRIKGEYDIDLELEIDVIGRD
jgi:UDP-N-acetylmuramate dehydrogenase